MSFSRIARVSHRGPTATLRSHALTVMPSAALLGFLLLAGCAATPDRDSATAMLDQSSEASEQEVVGADKKKWVCKTEKITGSHRIERICYSREVARSLRDKTREGMFFHTRNTACTDCQDGG